MSESVTEPVVETVTETATETVTEPAATTWTQESAAKAIADLRRENASHRTKLNEFTNSDAAFKQNMAKLLGLADAEPDPAALTEQLTKAQSEARQRAVELAVYRAAGKSGADGDALLDSRSFLNSVNGLDPASTDFGQLVSDAVAAAISANTRLKTTAPAAARSGGEFTTAPAGAGAQWSMADIEKASPDQINKARESGLLRNLMGA